ncbi:hypothetical protein L873DRAFT_1673453 [Choiromyces venosus 120613-1]|uniref:Uncharacterized protein n=1 Tax=Choiromyces venosus 120613-1 TaxID=1336337 RepID=A0A3N4JVW3_9PEZI|nr:hypothetical protein L873DRAFT_1673453 [Choiromyces venosus 120613-1]
MERGKKPPLIRSNTGNLGSSKRHQILHTSPSLSLPFHLHRNHEDGSRSKVTAASPDTETYNYEYQANQHSASLPTSRKGSLHPEMPERKISVPRNKPTVSSTGREELSCAITTLQTSSQKQMHRLDATYSSVLQKLHELSGLAARLQELGEVAKSTVQEFDAADVRCRSEFRSQIRGIERFKDELGNIELLRERLIAQKERVRDYHERLDKIQEKIDRHKEMEMVWRRRASRRLRLLWGFISILVILWLLATAGNDSDIPPLQDDLLPVPPPLAIPTPKHARELLDISIVAPMLSDEALNEL